MINILRRIKWFIQRVVRGWSDCDIWGLDHHLARMILPRLKVFKKSLHGHPCELTEEKWNLILDKMVRAFEIVIADYGMDMPDIKLDGYSPETRVKIQKYYDEFENGIALFAKYYSSLWD